MNKQVSKSISVMRVIAMLYVAIYLHYLPLYTKGNSFIYLSGQILGFVGVSAFFAVSGFLFGYKDKDKHYTVKQNFNWLKSRAIRILVSYEIVVIVVAAVKLIVENEFSWLNFLFQVLNLQGIVQLKFAFPELGHTWFLSILMVCYLITPVLRLATSKKSQYLIFAVFIGVIVALSFLPTVTSASFTSSIMSYAVMYFYGKGRIDFNGVKNSIKYLAALLVALFIRLTAWYFLDDSVIYNIIVCLAAVVTVFAYFHLSIWLWGSIQKFKIWKALDKVVTNLDKISYEFYLTHAVVITGSTSISSGGYIEMFLLLIFSYVLAVLLNYISGIIIIKLKGKN